MVIQHITGDEFGLLSVPEKSFHSGTCMSFVTDPDGSGKWIYKYSELPERLNGWMHCADLFLCVVSGIKDALIKTGSDY